jgi:hypothetical protein
MQFLTDIAEAQWAENVLEKTTVLINEIQQINV